MHANLILLSGVIDLISPGSMCALQHAYMRPLGVIYILAGVDDKLVPLLCQPVQCATNWCPCSAIRSLCMPDGILEAE